MAVLDRVERRRETVVVERQGTAIAVMKPVATSRSRRQRREVSEADWAALRAAAGSWKTVDVDRFLSDNATSRRRSTRPAVEL
jgi:hypothetical protein